MGIIAKPALQELATKINEAGSTKEAIIETARFDEEFKRAKEAKEVTRKEEVKEETFEFNPEEIQPIVMDRKRFAKEIAVEVNNSDIEKMVKESEEITRKDKEISE